MVNRALLAWALLLAGCFPPPLDETGKRCDTTHSCGDGFTCFDLLCQRTGEIDAGPDNLLVNADFELVDAGQLVGWRVGAGDLESTATAHHGARAARVSSPDGGTTPTLLPQVAPIQATLLGQVYCARGWLRGEYSGDGGVTARLDISERFSDGGMANISASGATKLYDKWVLLEQQLVTLGDGKLDCRVEVTVKLKQGEAVLADELQLKRSAGGTCAW